jgi:hypothetical protein
VYTPLYWLLVTQYVLPFLGENVIIYVIYHWTQFKGKTFQLVKAQGVLDRTLGLHKYLGLTDCGLNCCVCTQVCTPCTTRLVLKQNLLTSHCWITCCLNTLYHRKCDNEENNCHEADSLTDIWGRCYDHKFLRFFPIFVEKNWRFS